MAKGVIFKYLDSISESDEIKVIALFSCPGKKGRQEYLEFYNKIFDSRLDRSALMRMCNAVNQFIMKIVSSDKFYIHVNSGQVITTFLSFSLACDYRIVADTTVYQNPCLELGLVPKGGGAFFLSKMLGPSKAYEVLLSCYDLPAKAALEMGLVNKVVPEADLEEAALETAYGFGQNRLSSLTGIKRLVNYSYKELKDYLEFENQELMKIIAGGRYKNQG